MARIIKGPVKWCWRLVASRGVSISSTKGDVIPVVSGVACCAMVMTNPCGLGMHGLDFAMSTSYCACAVFKRSKAISSGRSLFTRSLKTSVSHHSGEKDSII
jgi:hypothetical protein